MTLTADVGGSMLSIGRAAGVALMGRARGTQACARTEPAFQAGAGFLLS